MADPSKVRGILGLFSKAAPAEEGAGLARRAASGISRPSGVMLPREVETQSSAIVSPHVSQMAKAIASPEARTLSDEEIKSLLNASIVSRRKIPSELINHGALKTVFDTNRTGAANAKVGKLSRGIREPELFAGKQGQTYAALVEDPTVVVPENIWRSYGNYGLEFKPEIKSRTTISIGDLTNYGGFPETARLFSLIKNEQFPVLRDLARAYLDSHPKIKNSRRVTDPKFLDNFGKDDQAFWEWAGLTPIKNEFKRPFAGAIKVPRELTDLSSVPLLPHEQKLLESDPISEILKLNVRNNYPAQTDNNLDFIEAQIHGPVTTEDVARVYDYSNKPSSKTEKQFKKLGIDYVPVESQDYAEGGVVHMDKGGSMKEQFNPFAYLANLVNPGQYNEKPVRQMQSGDTGTIAPVQRNPLYGVPADLLQALHNTTIRNPEEMTGAEFISNLTGIPALAKTLDRLSGGFQLHSGSGQATQMLPETRDALLAVAPFAAKPAVAATRAAVRGVKAAEDATIGGLQRARIGRAAEQALQTPESTYAPLRERMENQGNLQLAVKPKGGNWAPAYSDSNLDSVLRSVEPLRRKPAVANADLGAEDIALNRWLDKKLTPYIRNEMGTPDDPIRLAHEKGYTHSPRINNIEVDMGGSWLPERTAEARVAAGFPEEGIAVQKHAEAGYPEENLLNTRKAEEWENVADTGITQSPAAAYQDQLRIARDSQNSVGNAEGALQRAEKNPWIEKLSPETPIYKIADEHTFASDLDFNHLVDELYNALRSGSDLPANLRLTPKQLEKVTVEQAVKRVNDINEWRLKEKSAVLKDNAATFDYKDYPDTGYKWVELKLPESVENGTKSLEEALKHEGNVMGHCVGGYCPDVSSGASRIFSLRDPQGKAHVTVEVHPKPQEVEGGKFSDIWDAAMERVSEEEFAKLENQHRDVDLFDAFRDMHGRYVDDSNATIESILEEFNPEKAAQFRAELQNQKPSIIQIKGKGNAKPIADYTPYVQDFVRSGEWSKVNEIEHTDLVDLNDRRSIDNALKKVSGVKSKSKIPQEYLDQFEIAWTSNPDASRFMTQEEFAQFIGTPPAEGYAEGGSVKSDFFIDPSSYAQSRSKQMFPKQKSEWTQQDAARHMLASGMMAQKFGPTVAKIAGLAHEHGNAPVKTIGYMLGIGKMPPDYDQDLHNNALGVQIGKEAKSQEDLESRIQAILNSATKQPTPGQPWIGRPNIPNQISDYARGGKVSTNPFDHLV